MPFTPLIPTLIHHNKYKGVLCYAKHCYNIRKDDFNLKRRAKLRDMGFLPSSNQNITAVMCGYEQDDKAAVKIKKEVLDACSLPNSFPMQEDESRSVNPHTRIPALRAGPAGVWKLKTAFFILAWLGLAALEDGKPR